jgi:hypothetical protein
MLTAMLSADSVRDGNFTCHYMLALCCGLLTIMASATNPLEKVGTYISAPTEQISFYAPADLMSVRMTMIADADACS